MTNNNIETEIGLLSSDWKVVKLGDCFDVKQGKQISAKESGEGKIRKPFLRTSNVFWGGVDISKVDEMYFTPEKFKNLKLEAGDILVCEGGDVGRTAIYQGELGECAYQNHLYRLQPITDYSNIFFALWMEYAILMKKLYLHSANRTTIPNLSASRLKDFPIPLPPLQEQKNIAFVLSAIQNAREKTEKVIEATQKLKKAMMRHLFTYGAKSPAEAQNLPLKDTEIGQIPEDWEVAKLGDIGNFQYGYTESASQKEIGPKFLRITDINLETNLINWNTVPYCKISNDEKYLLVEGDILIARIGATTGKTAIITAPPKSVFASYLIRYKTNQEVYAKYIYYFTTSNSYWYQVNANKEGKLKMGINTSLLKNFKIQLPPYSEQEQIASILSTLDKKIEKEQATKKALDELFKSMLDNLMTAKLRVNTFDFS